MIITVVCIVVTVTSCLAAAFRIVRQSSWAAGSSFRILLLGLAIPIQAIIVPLYLIIYKLHLYDTLPLVVLFIVMRKQVMRSLGSVAMR